VYTVQTQKGVLNSLFSTLMAEISHDVWMSSQMCRQAAPKSVIHNKNVSFHTIFCHHFCYSPVSWLHWFFSSTTGIVFQQKKPQYAIVLGFTTNQLTYTILIPTSETKSSSTTAYWYASKLRLSVHPCGNMLTGRRIGCSEDMGVKTTEWKLERQKKHATPHRPLQRL